MEREKKYKYNKFKNLEHQLNVIIKLKKFKNSIAEHGAYHEKNLEKTLNNPNVKTYYNDSEILLLKAYSMYANYKVTQLKKDFFKLMKNDNNFLDFLKNENKKLYHEVLNA